MNCPAKRWKARKSQACFLSARLLTSQATWGVTISNGRGLQERQREELCKVGIFKLCVMFCAARTQRIQGAGRLRRSRERSRPHGPKVAGTGHSRNARRRALQATIAQSPEANRHPRFFHPLGLPKP